MLRFRLALPLVCLALGASLLTAQSGAACNSFVSNRSALSDERRLAALQGSLRAAAFARRQEVLFTVTHATADGAGSHLWIVSTAAGSTDKPRQLTFSPPADKRGEHNAQWAPDSSAIFFLAKRGENTQLFRLDLRGGEASPYDLKILPPVDVSKDKDAINPPPAPESAMKR